MPDERQNNWVREFLGPAAANLLSGDVVMDEAPPSANDPPPTSIKIGFPHRIPPTQGLGEPTVKLGGATIVEQGLGPEVEGPKRNMLYAFLNDSGTGLIGKPFDTGIKLNADGRATQAKFIEMSKRQAEWSKRIAALHKNDGMGGVVRSQVQKASEAIGGHGRGPEGKYLREAIEAYRDAVENADGQWHEIATAISAYKISQDKVALQSLQVDIIVADRTTHADREKFEAEQKKVDEQKKQIEKFFEIAAHMVEPQHWSSLAVAAVGCVSEQVLENTLVSTSHLDELRDALEKSRTNLKSLQDLAQVKSMEIATEQMSLDAAKVDNARLAFAKFAGDVELKETTVIEALKQIPATQDAGKLAAKRKAISNTATEADKMLQAYLQDAAPFVRHLKALGDMYRSYRSTVVKDTGDAPYNVPYRGELADIAERNADTLAEFTSWMQDQLERASIAVKYLAKEPEETYFAGYSNFPDALKGALVKRND
jgi:hypothetical protein